MPILISSCQETETKSFFPLTKGSYWLYEGLTKWTKLNSGEVIEKNLIWKMEVVDNFAYKSMNVAILKGHPKDLAWYDENKNRGDYIIIYGLVNGLERFIIFDDDQSKEILKKISNGEELNLNDPQYSDYNLFLELPLKVGETFTNSRANVRPDYFYCWFVESKDQVQFKNVKGLSSSNKLTRYRLVYRSNPDETIVEYIYRIGITRYVYKHHGTIAETNLKLIEYKKGKDL